MPELPEMETYRRLLAENLVGRKITGVAVNREKSVNMPEPLFAAKLMNRTVTDISRRAKHLLFHLDSDETLLLHLMLGGWMHLGTEQDKPDRSTQVELSFSTFTLYFIGLRLGYLHLLNDEVLRLHLAPLGPEPLSSGFTETFFSGMVKRKKGTLKLQLVDQKWIAGIGNCYSDEICFAAKLLPTRRIDELSPGETGNLYHSIHLVLNDAIRKGGYMENPLFAGDALTGGYNDSCLVYDRGGEQCGRCGGEIVQDEISARKMFYCPGCQL
ncbi:endonuclease VIII [Paenibacillus filicis]|uniref:Endonuclease VIII n=1 Tax=Paenibacillus gyeongsangnamensis TaxID=3388067 RepID=A0ABT4QG67_9BACL|nr:DNA-formamidopyrimidine glycosylase family protein [Paenibacillus filicis]MCZ8515861.1 endonuclease VIII [Paenibacillus filicis]